MRMPGRRALGLCLLLTATVGSEQALAQFGRGGGSRRFGGSPMGLGTGRVIDRGAIPAIDYRSYYFAMTGRGPQVPFYGAAGGGLGIGAGAGGLQALLQAAGASGAGGLQSSPELVRALLGAGGLGRSPFAPSLFGAPLPIAKRSGNTPIDPKRPGEGAGAGAPPGDLEKWPSWLQIGGAGRRVLTVGADAGPKANSIYLARLNDGVSLRPAGADAAYPLAFWDGERVLEAGDRVQLDGHGRAVMICFDGARIDLLRRSDVTFSQGRPERLDVALHWVTRLDARTVRRPLRLALSDGSTITTKGEARLTLQMESREAPWSVTGTDDRLIVQNWGPGSVRLNAGPEMPQEARGGIDLAANRQVTLALRRPSVAAADAATAGQAAAQDLDQTLAGARWVRISDSATVRRSGSKIEIHSRDQDAVVEWGGSRIRVPKGRGLVLDPIQGRPFGPDPKSK